MADVYEGAAITLAAAWSNNSEAGCFAPAMTGLHGIALSEGNLYFRDDLDVFPCYPGLYISKWPLFERAWVYQERRLSTCVLYFGKQQLFWECKSKLLSEYDLEGSFIRSYDLKSSEYEEDPEAGWRTIVGYYSQLSLTYEKDRLPAISACVKKMQRLRQGDVYIAGIWKKTLPHDLCWYLPPGENLLRRPDNPENMTPSWSWISTSSGVSYQDDDVPLFSPDDISVVYNITGPAHIGQVSHASIYLKAHFMFMKSDESLPWEIFEHPDGIPWDNLPPIWCHGIHWDFDHTTADPPIHPNARLIALPLSIRSSGSDHFGVVLRELANKQFERVGHFTGYDESGRTDGWSVERARESIMSLPTRHFTIV